MKRFFQITFLIICILAYLKKDKIKRYFVEQRYYSILLEHHIIKHCYSPYQDLLKIFAQEGFDYYKYDQKITSDSLNKLENAGVKMEKTPKIPTILHKIHLDTEDSNNKLLSFYLEEFKLNFNNFNKLNSTWKYIIWTNKPEIFIEISAIKNVEIRNVKEFEDHPYYEMFDDMMIKGAKVKTYFGKASNLLRLMAIQKFGGIYSDNDSEIYEPKALVNLVRKFDFIGVRENIRKESYYTNSFIAAKANHPVIIDALERSKINYSIDSKDADIPEYLKYPCNLYNKMIMGSATLLTLAYFANNNVEGNIDIILPSWMIMNQEFAQYKNNNCKLAEITADSFNETTNKLPILLENFMNTPKLQDWQYKCNKDNPDLQNIYYNIKYRKSYPIIGADPACASWASGYQKKYLYFNYPWQWRLIADKNISTNQTCQ